MPANWFRALRDGFPKRIRKRRTMNQTRRKSLQKLLNQLQPLEPVVVELRYDIEALKEEEQEYRDAMPDGIGEGTRGEAADAAIEALEEAINLLEQVQSEIVDAAERIEEAMA
ncbi:hypothetical protein [Rhizobium leguminosarum]|uniref:hypothetical protein n=1 Tax=Rhizobium TaxID=379 RepID=UPI00103B20BC|nr:hypothetical protein [Rhizobium leguminosarum]TCA72259.1 hypothetical protein E0H69_18585 [Rhizobium leguminosarum bv. viciae]